MESSSTLPPYYRTDHGHREGNVVIVAIFSVFLTLLLLVIRILMTWASESNLLQTVACEVAACVSHSTNTSQKVANMHGRSSPPPAPYATAKQLTLDSETIKLDWAKRALVEHLLWVAPSDSH